MFGNIVVWLSNTKKRLVLKAQNVAANACDDKFLYFVNQIV